jgi:hypothetical protein
LVLQDSHRVINPGYPCVATPVSLSPAKFNTANTCPASNCTAHMYCRLYRRAWTGGTSAPGAATTGGCCGGLLGAESVAWWVLFWWMLNWWLGGCWGVLFLYVYRKLHCKLHGTQLQNDQQPAHAAGAALGLGAGCGPMQSGRMTASPSPLMKPVGG